MNKLHLLPYLLMITLGVIFLVIIFDCFVIIFDLLHNQ